MSDFKFNCPHCGQSLEAPEDMLGETITCPACTGSIVLPEPESTPPPLPRSPSTSARGTKFLNCQSCNNPLEVNPYLSDVGAACPYCSHGLSTLSLIERIKFNFSLAFAHARGSQYRLFSWPFASFYTVWLLLHLLCIVTMVAEREEIWHGDLGQTVVGLTVISLMFAGLPVVGLLSAAIAVKQGKSKWGAFFSSFYLLGIPLLFLALARHYLRPAELGTLPRSASPDQAPAMLFRGTNRALMICWFVLLIPLAGVAALWCWPPLTYTGTPIIDVNGTKYRFRWNKQYFLPTSGAGYGIQVYLPLLSFGYSHWWRACRASLSATLAGGRRFPQLTYKPPPIPWIGGRIVSE